MARQRHHQQKQQQPQQQQHVSKGDHTTTPWIIRGHRKSMSSLLTSTSFISTSKKSFMFGVIALFGSQCVNIVPIAAAFTTPYFGLIIEPTQHRVLPITLQQQPRLHTLAFDNSRKETNYFVSTSATTSLFVTTTNTRSERNRNRWKKSNRNNNNNSTAMISSSPPSPVCTEDDIRLIHEILIELKIDPITETPWGTTHPEGSTRTFNYILQKIVDRQHNIAKRTRNLAEEVLRYMIQQNRSVIRPDLITLNLVLASYYNSIAASSSSLLTTSTSRGRGDSTKDTIPSNPPQQGRQINQNQSSFPSSSSSAAADTAYALLHEWDTVLYPNQLTSQRSDRVSYNTVISAYGKSGNYQRAQIVFDELLNKSKENQNNYQPDIISYNCLLNSMALVGQSSSAMELFHTMLYDPQIPNPTIHSYNDVLYSLSKSDHPYEAYIFLLEWLSLVSTSGTGGTTSSYNRKTKYFHSDRTDGFITIKPNTYSYNIVLHAMTQAIRQENQKRSKQDQQQRRQKQQPPSQQKPPVRGSQAKIPSKNRNNKNIRKKDRSYINDNEYKNVDTRNNNDASSHNLITDDSDFLDPDTLHRTVEELFHRMPHRDIITYTTFIAALCEIAKYYSKNSNSNNNNNKKVVVIFDTIRTVLLDGIHTDPSINNVMIDASFVSNVLYSLAIMENIQAAVFADEMIETMIGRYKSMRPTVQLYNALLYCWGKSSSSTSTWQSSVDVGQRVLAIINEMEQNPLLQPNTITYTNAMDALKSSSSSLVSSSSRSSSIEVAEAILTKMEQSNDYLPNVYTYTTMIQNYARSRLPHKAVKAYNIIQRMKSKPVQPNIISYNAVLNACEHTDPTFDPIVTDDALKVACIVFDEIRASKTIYPNHITYATFLGSMASLLPSSVPARNEIINLVFKRCCYDGQVSGLVLKKLRIIVETDEQYDALLDGGYRSNDGDDIILPSDWTRNVQNDFITKSREIS